jgi:hypothetical protein
MGLEILLIDDGEIEVARTVLAELELEFEDWRASKLDGAAAVPSSVRMLITTGRFATLMEPRQPDQLAGHWIAVVEGDSKTQRTRLRKAGFDYLIPSQSHAAVVRALLLKCIYRGRERHSATRVALGIAVDWRSGWHSGRALLVDLSMDGCRLMLDTRPERGQSLTVRIPVPGRRGTLRVRGEVVRTAPARSEGGREGQVAVGLRFRSLSDATRTALDTLLRERSAGPSVYTGPDAVPVLGAASREIGHERQLARASYGRELDAMCSGATRALLGRDLSESGVRVEPSEKLALRERVRLALHGCPTGEPIMVEAHVDRDDGAQGLVLRFDSIDPADLVRLRHLIATLPKVIRRLEDDVALHALELSLPDRPPDASR